MPEQPSFKWYRNGEDIFFENEAFHKLAYQIIDRYQNFMAIMDQKYDAQMSYLIARKEGWVYEPTLAPDTFIALFHAAGFIPYRSSWKQRAAGMATTEIREAL